MEVFPQHLTGEFATIAGVDSKGNGIGFISIRHNNPPAMSMGDESPSEWGPDATIPLLLGIVLLVVFSTQELITSGSLVLVSLHSSVKWGFVVAAVVLLLVVLLSPGTIWGPVALVSGLCGFVVAAVGIFGDHYPTVAGYAVVTGMALVVLAGGMETLRQYLLGGP